MFLESQDFGLCQSTAFQAQIHRPMITNQWATWTAKEWLRPSPQMITMHSGKISKRECPRLVQKACVKLAMEMYLELQQFRPAGQRRVVCIGWWQSEHIIAMAQSFLSMVSNMSLCSICHPVFQPLPWCHGGKEQNYLLHLVHLATPSPHALTLL